MASQQQKIPSPVIAVAGSSAPAPSSASTSPEYLVQFVHRHLDFRKCEFDSVLQSFSLQPQSVYKASTFDMLRPFLKCAFPSREVARSVANATVLVKNVYVLNGIGGTTEECVDDSKPFADKDTSWKISFNTFAWKFTKSEQTDIMHKFIDKHEPAGPVSMKTPGAHMSIIHEYPVHLSGAPVYPRRDHTGLEIPSNVSRPPLSVYFAQDLEAGGRDMVDKYDLKKRTYLGPTSMDNELSLIMCNAGSVGPNSRVLDPFVGTGSILFSATVLGGRALGSDIDPRVLRGKGEGGVFSNFDKFGLPPPDIVRADSSMFHSVFSKNVSFDAIITDPPYGIRAGARKSGTSKERTKVIPAERRHDHVPQTQVYPVSDVMSDLLTLAARSLTMGGRMVYLIPSLKDFDEGQDLPRHPCLELEWVCYQPLSLHLGRRMVVVKKVRPWEDEREEEWRATCWPNGRESAEKVERLREQLAKAGKEGQGEDDGKTKKRRKKEQRNEVTIKSFAD